MKRPGTYITIFAIALLVAAPPYAADAAQAHATASAHVIAPSEVGTIDSAAMVAATSAGAAPAPVSTTTSSPQIEVIETDGALTISIDYN